MQEIDIMKTTDHPNIIKFYEYFEDNRYVYLVMEECTGGELFDEIIRRLEAGSIFTEKEAALYFRQMMSAICYCHKMGICHRDLKPENLLLVSKDADSEIKVIDFGLSNIFKEKGGEKETEKKMSTKVGTAYYVSPEVLSGDYDEKCDIWSAGVILYILLCGDPPFNGKNDNDIYRSIKKKKFTFPDDKWANISSDVKNLITRMLSDPNVRPSAEEILQDIWVTELAPNSTNAVLNLKIDALRGYKNSNKLKKAVLTFISNRLKEDDIKNLKEIFLSIDKNGDGHLTLEEVKESLSKLGDQSSNIVELFESIDTDGSGTINYTGTLL